MASPTHRTWIWANSRRQWRTRKPGMLQSMGVTKSWTWLSNWTTKTGTFTATCITILFYSYSQVALVVKNPSASAGDIRDRGSIPGWERSLSRGHGNPLQYSFVHLFLHSSILAWKTQWTEEPSGLHCISSKGGRHDWSDLSHTHFLSQWSGLFAFTAEDPGPIPTQRTKILQAMWCSQKQKQQKRHKQAKEWKKEWFISCSN